MARSRSISSTVSRKAKRSKQKKDKKRKRKESRSRSRDRRRKAPKGRKQKRGRRDSRSESQDRKKGRKRIFQAKARALAMELQAKKQLEVEKSQKGGDKNEKKDSIAKLGGPGGDQTGFTSEHATRANQGERQDRDDAQRDTPHPDPASNRYDFIYQETQSNTGGEEAAPKQAVKETPGQIEARKREEEQVIQTRQLLSERFSKKYGGKGTGQYSQIQQNEENEVADVFFQDSSTAVPAPAPKTVIDFGSLRQSSEQKTAPTFKNGQNEQLQSEDILDLYMKDIEKKAVKQVRFGGKLEMHLDKLLPEKFRKKTPNLATKNHSLVITSDDISSMKNTTQQEEEEEGDEKEQHAFIEALKGRMVEEVPEEGEIASLSSDRSDHNSVVFSDSSEEEEMVPEKNSRVDFFAKMEKIAQKKQLKPVDHSTIDYIDFRKDFYIDSEEINKMTEEDIELFKESMGGIKTRGNNPPRPIMNWYQCGLSDRILNLLTEKYKFEAPFAIQCQAIPVIMKGRDCIGVAETGSGKTLAFLLPMLRHISYQPPLGEGDGPIALIMVPTRELAQQVFNAAKGFCKVMGLRCACIFGGGMMSTQLSDLKRGAEIVVCTPGRMIDLLSKSGGRCTNFRRVTYIVLDEADRMFDLGFEPQISKLLTNVRPDRQTVLFSATFPRNVETLAKKILQSPIEVVVGNRGQVCRNVIQKIEIIDPEKKLLRLLDILTEWFTKGQILIFVHTQEEADFLFTELMSFKYNPLVIHGGQDTEDRQITINEFKRGSRSIMISTSLCSRGLDIKNLVLVINYSCPSHKEDYIHRIGRTGRAGRKGTAITFISKKEEGLTGDIIHAMQISNAEVPEELLHMNSMFMVKVRRGEAKNYTGLGVRKGNGYGFEVHEYLQNLENKKKGLSVKSEVKQSGGLKMIKLGAPSSNKGTGSSSRLLTAKKSSKDIDKFLRSKRNQDVLKKAAYHAANQALSNGATKEHALLEAEKAYMSILQRIKSGEMPHFDEELANVYSARDQVLANETNATGNIVETFEINEYPESARQKLQHKDYLNMIQRLTGCRVSVRGIYVLPGKIPLLGQKKLHVHIEGETEYDVYGAFQEVKRTLEDGAFNVLNSASVIDFSGANQFIVAFYNV